MEVVYFLISVIEIVLTCYLVCILKNTRKAVEEKNAILEKLLICFSANYKKAALILKITGLSFGVYKKYTALQKYISKVTQGISVLSFLKILKKNKSKKFTFIPFLRKILFFI